MKQEYSISFPDRFVSCLSYITVGWIGLIYCIIRYIQKKPTSQFIRYNVFQAIFISLLYFVACMVLGFVFDLLMHIPFLGTLISWIYLFFNHSIIAEYSIIQIFICGLFLYMAVSSLFGRYPRVYWISSKVIDPAAR